MADDTREAQAAHEALRSLGRKHLAEVLGSDYLAARAASTNALNAPLRALSEEFAYGTLWAGTEFDRRERSLLTLALLCALNRPHELRLHVGAALNNGVSPERICAVFVHAAIYCGLPAAIDAQRCAEEVFRERGLPMPPASSATQGARRAAASARGAPEA